MNVCNVCICGAMFGLIWRMNSSLPISDANSLLVMCVLFSSFFAVFFISPMFVRGKLSCICFVSIMTPKYCMRWVGVSTDFCRLMSKPKLFSICMIVWVSVVSMSLLLCSSRRSS